MIPIYFADSLALHEWQIGAPDGMFFDLVNHEKLPPEQIFRIGKDTRFVDFKETVAQLLSIPANKQRYWIMAPRANGAYRPCDLLPYCDERQLVEMYEYRDQVCSSPSPGHQSLRSGGVS